MREGWRRVLRCAAAIVSPLNLINHSLSPPSIPQPIVHVAFIPAILALGMACTEPRPSLIQLLAPM